MEIPEVGEIVGRLRKESGYAKAKEVMEALPQDLKELVISTSRKAEVVLFKAQLIKLFKDEFDLSFTTIARLLDKHHSSVVKMYYKLGGKGEGG